MTDTYEARQQAKFLLAQYDELCRAWSELNHSSGSAPDVKECEFYSDTLESLAHKFALVLRTLAGGEAA